MRKFMLAIAICTLASASIPASAFATHTSGCGGGGCSSRAQKYEFYYGSSLPVAFQGPVNRGFAAWDVGGQCHDFRLGGQIATLFGFVDGGSSPGSPSLLATTSVDHSTIYFDSAEAWYSGTGTPGISQFDVQSTAAHEAGHTLSLAHTGAVSGDTMYPSQGTQDTSFRTLTTHDVQRIQTLYPYGTCVM